MTAGLPGAGIGGLFYLASALLMPARSLVLTLRGRRAEARWGLALRQSALAAGVIGALWATGELLGRLLSPAARQALATSAGQAAAAGPRNMIGTHALAFSMLTLVAVLIVVQVARAIVPALPPAVPAPQAVPDSERTAA